MWRMSWQYPEPARALQASAGVRPLLVSFLIGSHHRVSHAVLVEWLERNQKFQRDGV